MHRNLPARLSFSVIAVGTCVFLAGASLLAGEDQAAKTPTVAFATRHGESAPLREYKPVGPVQPRPNREIRNEIVFKKGSSRSTPATDPVAQTRAGVSQPEPLTQFEGGSDDDNAAVNGGRIVPPDPNGDVGPNHYAQYINSIATIYDKTGNTILGPFKGNAFWAGFGGPCEIQNDGDPIVKYDRQADRWVFTQFSLPNYPAGPFYQCFAVSKTNDPTGAYWLYEFKTSDTFFSDYPKLGVWPDAYYMTFNMFGPSSFLGGAYAFDRSAMLNGDAAGMIMFDTGQDGGVLPSDLDGSTPPPDGAPNYFMTFEIDPPALRQWQFHVDWTTPSDSTFTGPIDIPVAPMIWPVCGANRSQCVPQQDSPEKLETLDGDLMFRLPYRNYGDHQSLVASHTVGTASGPSGVRWYEIRTPDAPVLYQQGTYSPDSTYRWMGSIAMDGNGNIALGYSASSANMHPSIAITGRLAGDPLGLMGSEDIWFAGGGSQTGSSSRWGDYSSMAVDPTDDCTFWYQQEYYASTGSFDFNTRIGSFKFPSCTSGAAGMLEGTVTDGASNPIAGATVTATPSGARPGAAGASSTTTDAAGHYQFLTLPAGSYDMTASDFGYATGTINGVAVTDGGDTVQNFALAANVSALVVGTVKDGSGQGWPLYARLEISGPPGFPLTVIFTDPATGYYQITLPAGATYQFLITAVSPGYTPGGGPLNLVVEVPAAASVVVNWTLFAAAPCNAPGYGPGSFVGAPRLLEGFDAGTIPAGWTVDTVTGTSWQVASGADPCFQFDGNRTGGSGPYAILNSGCFSNLNDVDDSSLVTPPIDLSASTSVAIQWANDFIDMDSGSMASVDVSADGGATWTNIWSATTDVPGPSTQLANMSLAAGHASAKARFHYQGFWAWWWQVDDIEVGNFTCAPLPGGLVVGTVSDANYSFIGLNGATVANTSGGGSTTTFATPEDPNQGDGLYILFSESGSQSFQASSANHEPLTKSTTVIPTSSVRLDFALAAGILDASPRPLNAVVSPGGTQDLTLTMSNTGTGNGSFVIKELNEAPPIITTRPAAFASPAARKAALKRVPFNRMNDRNQRDLPRPPAPSNARALAQGGNVVASFPSSLASGWGLAYDTSVNRLWISNPDAPDFGFSGDGLEYAYLPDGTQTVDTIDIHATGGSWQADGTYNARTGMIWQVNVGGDRCLFEIDPVAKAVTGKEICGPWQSSERAVAYDYATDTYYVAGTNDDVLYHVDGAGNLLDSASTGIGTTGIAYNPSTGHLFVAAEFPGPFNIWVLDAKNGYAVLGGFVTASGGVPVLTNGGASLEADCDGRLWAIDDLTQIVYEFESGESGWCANEIPWVSETPTSGTVAGSGGGSRPAGGGNTLPVTVTFDSQSLLPGLRQGQLIFLTDTPTSVQPVGLSLTVLFNDVPIDSFASNFIYGAAGAGVMPGCAPQAPTSNFCPNDVVTRRSMAGFIERAVHGSLTPPPVYQGEFSDVLLGSFNANYIQGLVDDGITVGCGQGNYCPENANTRAQMAVFIWKAQHGSTPPPACAPPGVFSDVPCPDGFAVDYIEAIYAENITVGCGNGNYCPDATITNAQMAVFLVKAFNIPLLLP